MPKKPIREAEFGPPSVPVRKNPFPVSDDLDVPSREQLELIGLTPETWAQLDPGKQVRARAAISDKLARRRAVDPERGHKRIAPHDYSGPDPAAKVIPGQIAPKLAGERAKALMILGRVMAFIDKYSKKAVDRFSGYGPPKAAKKPVAAPPRKPVPGIGMTTNLMVPDPTSAGEGGHNVDRRGALEQMMSKERAIKLVEQLPMMSSEQMSSAVRMLAGYVWRIHKTARAELKEKTIEALAARGQTKLRKYFNPETGEEEERPYYEFHKDPVTGKEIQGKKLMTKGVDTDDPTYKAALAQVSREFEADSTQIKADLNLLFSAAGALKKAGGFGGAADKEFLRKVMSWRGVKAIEPQEPTVKLPPELAKLAGDYPRAEPKSQKGKIKAKGPIIHKAEKPFEPSGKPLPATIPPEWIKDSFDRYLGLVIEVACADPKPAWWGDL